MAQSTFSDSSQFIELSLNRSQQSRVRNYMCKARAALLPHSSLYRRAGPAPTETCFTAARPAGQWLASATCCWASWADAAISSSSCALEPALDDARECARPSRSESDEATDGGHERSMLAIASSGSPTRTSRSTAETRGAARAAG